SGGVDYFTHCDSRGTHDLWQGEAEHREDGYLTDLISTRAVETIGRFAAGGAPFFLSVHYTAPHWPWETRDDAALAEEVKDNLFHLHGGNIHTYRRMIEHMDEGIGRIVAALAAAGVAADPAHPLDGVSLLPVLDDPAQAFERPLFWRMNHRGQRALRDGRWKYLRVDGHDYLFDLAADERERANLGKRQPERLA